jgi:hypothetical protein
VSETLSRRNGLCRGLVAATILLLAGCGDEAKKPVATATVFGHQRMRELLEQIARRAPDEHPLLGTRNARELRKQLAAIGDGGSPLQRWKLHSQLGWAELALDEIDSGIEQLALAVALLPDVEFPGATPARRKQSRTLNANYTRYRLGVAYLRLGETENCCRQYTAESCIVPIRGEGLHTKQAGSRQAIEQFLEVLKSPRLDNHDSIQTHLASRWLLNIASMTIGKYPDGVPEEFRIAPQAFKSKIDFPRFTNVGPKLGLETFNLCGGAIVDDFDNDDYLDIVTSTYDPAGQARFFHNNRDGSFSDQTDRAGLSGFFGGLNMVHADYDNDGDPDILVLRGAWLEKQGQHPNSLLRNNGNGTFTDVTFAAGLGEVHYPTKTAAWADYDNDGDLDLYIGNESSPNFTAPCQLFRNNGNGTFTDVARAAGVRDTVFAMGSVWGDYNGDRLPDLYVSTGGNLRLSNGGPNRLYRNNGDGTFTDVARALKVTRPLGSFPVWFWDFDNDGVLDLFVGCSTGSVGLLALNPLGVGTPTGDASIRTLQQKVKFELTCLYRGDGKGGFQEVAREQNLTYATQPMGANFGDLDNDGFLDFYLGTGDVEYSELRPNLMFLNQRGRGFANVTMAGGFGHLQKGHGVAFADLDNDGDQDVYVQTGGAIVGDKFNDALFENPGFKNHWITIKLEGRESNTSAIGARIKVGITENGKQRSIYRHVNSGGSFGCNPLRQSIGLGTATRVETLEIFWPTTGRTQTLENIAADQLIRITENVEGFEPLPLKRLQLRGRSPAETR